MIDVLNTPAVDEIAGGVFEKIAPVWPLDGFVAVNPLWGCIAMPFSDALQKMQIATGQPMDMPSSYYAGKFSTGEITADDLHVARQRQSARAPARLIPDVQAAIAAIRPDGSSSPSHQADAPHAPPCPPTVFDRLPDALRQPLLDHIVMWCSAYFDRGQAAWNMMDHSQRFYAAWYRLAILDRLPEIAGLKGCRAFIKSMPPDPAEALSRCIELISLPPHLLADYFYRLLLDHIGWASHLRLHTWQHTLPPQANPLFDLLAIRAVYEAAAFKHLHRQSNPPAWGRSSPMSRISGAALSALWLEAHETAFERQLTTALRGQIAQGRLNAPLATRPAAQCVFCIDVRSERFRRAVETAAPSVQTVGFAGFFGFPIRYSHIGDEHSTIQFPVLLSSRFHVGETIGDKAKTHQRAAEVRSGRQFSAGWSQLTAYGVSSLNFVEMLGLGYGWKLLRDGIIQPTEKTNHSALPDVSHSAPVPDAAATHPHLSLDDQIAMAKGALKNMGLRDRLARLVLFCGHGAETANNPYKASLDCGACGGHAGGPNARVAAAVLNKDAVRTALAADGLHIPADTWFIAGEHNTTTDEVTIYDADALPASHSADIALLREQLTSAGELVRAEKAAAEGDSPHQSVAVIKRAALGRAADWAQVRPEWGLAGNAAFIAAPRSLTSGLKLDGRAFLHDYHWRQDDDASILTLIMTAPMVVAHWINMQYFASTVCPGKWGAGSKTIHNVVGMHGVCSGNAGDLQVGLPIESLHDGKKWRHDPLRLLAVIAAPRDNIAGVIRQHSLVQTLLDNQWIHLLAIDDRSDPQCYRYVPGMAWEMV